MLSLVPGFGVQISALPQEGSFGVTEGLSNRIVVTVAQVSKPNNH